MAGPVIRDGTLADIEAIRAIYAVEVTDGTASFELEPPSTLEMATRFEAVRSRGLPWLVAELDGRVAGYAYAALYHPRPGYRCTVESSVYVARDARRAGVGRALLDALIDRATAAGKRQMLAIIGDSANVASIRLHERAGFRHVGTLHDVGFKFGRWLDTVLMQRALGEGADTLPEE